MLEVVNPFDLKPIGEVPMSTWDDADRMLEIAHKVFKDRSSHIPTHKRIDILKKISSLMEKRFDELAFQIANEGGKPLIDARVETTRAIDGVELAIKELLHLRGTEIPMDLTEAGAGRMAFTTREPIGVVVALSAFNHPLNLIVHQVVPAIAVGCPVIVKPAGDTPLSAQTFVEIAHEAGLPEEWCQFIVCENDVAEKLVTDERVEFMTFIGSARIGWMLHSKLAHGTRSALEHGGVAPVIVDETADIDTMIPSLLKGGFYHAGQVCVSVQRVFAPKSMAGDIAEALAEGAQNLKVGNAIDEITEVGPLIRPNEVKRVSEWIDEAAKSGKVLCGAEKLSDTTYAPTVILDPANDSKLATQEIFGPALAVFSYDNIDEAIARSNSLDYAFQASVFTNNLDMAMKSVREIDATAVMVNDHTAFRVDWMPFAGRRHSGYNTGGIGYTMHDMTQDKMAVIKL